MRAILTYVKAELYHIVNGEKKKGLHSGLLGNVSPACAATCPA
jgi:hypothetical protein